MAFSAVFPRVLRPPFGPGLAAAAATADWWEVAGKTCVIAYQAIGAASQAASYVNLANPGTYDATPGVAPTWSSAAGWMCDGTRYLNTGYVPPDTNLSVLVRYANMSTGVDFNTLCGSLDGSGYYIVRASGAGVRSWWNGGTGGLYVVPDTITSGVMGQAGLTAYFDGSSVGTIPGGTQTSGNMYVCAASFGGGTYYPFTGDVLAFVAYSDTLTGGEMATVYAAMAALTG